jgi:hypothetical protein
MALALADITTLNHGTTGRILAEGDLVAELAVC